MNLDVKWKQKWAVKENRHDLTEETIQWRGEVGGRALRPLNADTTITTTENWAQKQKWKKAKQEHSKEQGTRAMKYKTDGICRNRVTFRKQAFSELSGTDSPQF